MQAQNCVIAYVYENKGKKVANKRRIPTSFIDIITSLLVRFPFAFRPMFAYMAFGKCNISALKKRTSTIPYPQSPATY